MLQRTERFQNDVSRYRESIEKIANETVKNNAQKLLNNLIAEVSHLDISLTDMVYKKQIGSKGQEIREKIAGLRKELDKICGS